MHRVSKILSQLQVNNTSASNIFNSDGSINSPYTTRDIPTNLSFHKFLFNKWESDNYYNLNALTDAVTGETWTYKQLKQNIIWFSNALSKLGVTDRSVVLIYSPNTLTYSTVVYACSVLGTTVALVNPTYTDKELLHHLTDSGATHVFTVSERLPALNAVRKNAPNIKHVYTFDKNDANLKTFDEILKQGQQLGDKPIAEKTTGKPQSDVAILPYSSGTTGLSKGVELTHYNLIANLIQVTDSNIDGAATKPGERIICVLPLYHIYAASCIMNGGLYMGSHIIILPRFDPTLYLQSIQKYKIQRFALVPPLINFMIKTDLTQKFDLSSITHVNSGAAPLSRENEDEFARKFKKVQMKQGYGLTETSPVTHGHPAGNVRRGAIGKLLGNMKAMIVDNETGKPITKTGTDNRGELWVKGPNIMKGYHNNKQATQNTIDNNGYLHTGDVAYIDNDGFFYIVDRIKELIKVKGLQVAPAELEGLLLSHPEIDDAAVIPIPDERAGELPRAYIVRRAGSKVTEQQIKDYIAKQVAPHKKLDGGVKFIDAIPKAASGKILRRQLRELAKKTG